MVEPEVFSLNDEAVVLLPELFVQLYPVPLPGGRGGEPGPLSPNTRSSQLTNQLWPFLTLENSNTETHLVINLVTMSLHSYCYGTKIQNQVGVYNVLKYKLKLKCESFLPDSSSVHSMSWSG